MARISKKFKFNSQSRVGYPDALEDKEYLKDCFIDRGHLDVLKDANDPRFIIIGRTGSGKSALLQLLIHACEKCKVLDPEMLALEYVSNIGIIDFLENELEVNLIPFYRLLWRHILTLEIIRLKYNITKSNERNRKKQQGYLDMILNSLNGNQAKKIVLDYFSRWGETFWETTQYNIQDITKKIETTLTESLAGELGVQLPALIQASLSPTKDKVIFSSDEIKYNIKKCAQQVVNNILIHELTQVMELLSNEILSDKQKKYYIIIDKLDEDWVDNSIRFELIRTLIEVARDFNQKLSPVKVMIALRRDLIDKVFENSPEGFQEEKIKALYVDLKWTPKTLQDVIKCRVTKLIKTITDDQVVLQSINDILPRGINNQKSIEYILHRTLFTPRDVILFFNLCIQKADGEEKLTQLIILQAEKEYSRERMYALKDEWKTHYPHLDELSKVLRYFPSVFDFDTLNQKIDLDIVHSSVDKEPGFGEKKIKHLLQEWLSNTTTQDDIAKELIKVFHITGIIGIRLPLTPDLWSFSGDPLPARTFSENAKFIIHPAFYEFLGTKS